MQSAKIVKDGMTLLVSPPPSVQCLGARSTAGVLELDRSLVVLEDFNTDVRPIA